MSNLLTQFVRLSPAFLQRNSLVIFISDLILVVTSQRSQPKLGCELTGKGLLLSSLAPSSPWLDSVPVLQLMVTSPVDHLIHQDT